jgi:hypothetical protein
LKKYARSTTQPGYTSYAIDSDKACYFIGSMKMAPNPTTQWSWQIVNATFSSTRMYPAQGNAGGGESGNS